MAELILSDSPRSRVIRSLKQWIADGSLAAGEPLPSERELSVRVGTYSNPPLGGRPLKVGRDIPTHKLMAT